MSTENIAHHFCGSVPAEDAFMNAVFCGENTAMICMLERQTPFALGILRIA